jgi:hypothetical protein
VRNDYTNLVGNPALKRPLGGMYVTELQCVFESDVIAYEVVE